jgi:hypothetical protein
MDGVNNAFCSSKEEYEIARLTTKCAGLQGKIESQAAEIGVLKIAHEAHQTNNLKMLAVLKKQAAEIEKYKALCDQMGVALDKAQFTGNPYNYHTTDALEAWRAMK